MFRDMLKTVVLAAVLCGSAAAGAEWRLDGAASSIGFVSIKNGDVGEAHHFATLSGAVDDSGAARVEIRLDSVETGIPIRNERMREMLFETHNYPAAVVTARVDPQQRGARQLTGELEMHGVSLAVELPVRVDMLGDGRVRVTSTAPVIVAASRFGMAAGIERLRQVAGLERIATAVPVSFDLVFEPVPES